MQVSLSLYLISQMQVFLCYSQTFFSMVATFVLHAPFVYKTSSAIALVDPSGVLSKTIRCDCK